MAGKIEHPYYPIIYVRGYAGSDNEVEDTVSDPYMGFNLGATKIRTAWTGKTERLFFESPLVRLMKDHDYGDVYSAGLNLAEIDAVPAGDLNARSIIIYRYYDQVSTAFGSGERATIEDFGRGLSDLILKVRDRICGTAEEREAFKIYLLGHSMGGLVVRCFLQNDEIGTAEAKALVDKVFTYATPHNGIEFEIVGNVPSFFSANNIDNFNRKRMCEYLGLPEGSKSVNTLNGKFNPDRFFCLVGTNPKDYSAAAGWSARVVGPFSDGLVRINNAVVYGPTGNSETPTELAPRAYVHRSHSGYYGIVNSEEGYQNFTRFLFGNIRIDGRLEIKDISLPSALEKMRLNGKRIRASYHFEAIARVRGGRWDLSRRLAEENSAVFRTYGELFPEKATADDRAHRISPELFTAFLSSDRRVDRRRRSLGFSIELGVLVPEYEVDGILFLKDHFPGGYIFRDILNLEAIPPRGGEETWRVRYSFGSENPTAATKMTEGTPTANKLEFRIPILQKKRPGIDARLVLTARNWNV